MINQNIGIRNKNTNLSKAPYLMDTLSKMIMLLVDVKLSDNAEKAAYLKKKFGQRIQTL